MSRRVLAAGAIWSVSILLSRLVGLVREAALGRTLGVGGEADLYQAAFTVPDLVNYLLAGGALAVVLVPLQAARLAGGDERAAWRSIGTIANAVGAALLALGALAWVSMPALTRLAAPGFDAGQQAELAALSRIVLPAQFFHVVGAVFSAALLARDRHAIAALAPVVYNIVIVACGLASGTAEGFAWGVLLGAFLGPFLLPLVASVKLGFRFAPRLEHDEPDLRAWLVRSLPIMAGFSIVVADDWFLRAQGSIAGEGAAATLGYAKALLRVPVGVFGMAAGLAAYPLLARLAAEGRTSELRAALSRALRGVVLLALAAQAVLVAAGVDLAALVYGRTRLAPSEVAGVAEALALCALGLAAWAAQPLLARGFYALGNTWAPALLGTAVALLAWPVYGLARERFGVLGLATTSAVAIGSHALVLHAALALRLRRAGAARPAGLWPFAARALTAFIVSLAVGITLSRAIPEAATTWEAALRATAIGSASLVVFAATGAAVGLAEIRAAGAPLWRRLRGAPASD
ncbi:MAG: virulence factor MviN [Planctomycetes bacterium]|nr:virulence factor MviN [Planctomycetota bacterium]